MNTGKFVEVITDQYLHCCEVLIGKSEEYATDAERLHNFIAAGGMMGCDPKEALAGMMAKHTISIYDMCRSGLDYPYELWTEKITDHINYLFLLKAVIEDERVRKHQQAFGAGEPEQSAGPGGAERGDPTAEEGEPVESTMPEM